MDTVIRPVAPAEAARLSDFMRELFVAAYRHCSTPENVRTFLDATYSEARQRAEIEDADIETVVVEDGDGTWLGFAQLRFAVPMPEGVDLPGGAELGRIYLAPAAQGRGIGTRLLRDLEARTLARGRTGLWLNAWQEASQALAFYRREGFEVVGTTVFVVGEAVTKDWRMAKRLAAAGGAE